MNSDIVGFLESISNSKRDKDKNIIVSLLKITCDNFSLFNGSIGFKFKGAVLFGFPMFSFIGICIW